MSITRAELDALIDDGLTLADCLLAFAARNTDEEQAYIAAAREHLHKDGEVEIDEPTVTSGSEDDGDYVLAWIWVSDDLTDKEG